MPDEQRMCEQNCGRPAECYGLDPLPGGWGGYYCLPCCAALGFRITDYLNKEPK
jgi:hypothetical protein